MPVKKMRFDSHGPYIRLDGHLYRPDRSLESGSENKKYYTGYKPQALAIGRGTEVNATILAHTPMVKVSLSKDVYDIWYSHGSYYDFNQRPTKQLKSEIVWCPIDE